MTQTEKATLFRSLHRRGSPLLLYNVWDAGSASAVADAGAKAIATGSHSVAAAQGFEDGEEMPLDLVLSSAARIVAATNLPTSIDFEGAYAETPDAVKANVSRLIETGAVGLNFEDQIVGGTGLYDMETQAARIEAVRAAAVAKGLPFVINARTDLFIQANEKTDLATVMDEAVARAARYENAGADCFFVPFLNDLGLISQLCDRVNLPVNIMLPDLEADLAPLRDAGLSRISYGPTPYRAAYGAISQSAERVLALLE